MFSKMIISVKMNNSAPASGRSPCTVAWKKIRPSPLMLKIYSTMTEPPISRNASFVMTGTSGISAFLKTCFQTMMRLGSPFALAVST